MSRRQKWVIGGLLVALIVAAFLSPFASTKPDGLERVAEDHGFLEKGEGKEVIKSPIPDYVMPGVANETLAGSLAGVVGTLLTFILFVLVGKILFRRSGDYADRKPGMGPGAKGGSL
ncbi:MAG: cobalt/nickel transport protein [Eubacteriales bacterium]|nr:cobalt/nickel transport protein [Eubacteriales bacterium]MDN5363159.1 cobalt/nickel transport protein [Eubacteriales bacterium]